MTKLAWTSPGKGSVVALAVVVLLAAAPSARASSCVRIDTTMDMLSTQDQKAALLVFEDALSREGRPIEPTSCNEEWVVSHALLGDSLVVVVASPYGRRSDRVKGLEELAAQYSQSIRALLFRQDPGNELGGVVDRSNVTSAQAVVRRVHSDSLFFVRIGYGYASGPGNGGGPSLGLGFRKELNRVALDLSFVNALVLSNRGGNEYSTDPLDGGSFTPVALGVNYHFRPLSNGTPYAGLGVGFTVWDPDTGESKGLDLRFSLGYEMFRASTVRLLVQADAILPTYEVTRRTWRPDGNPSAEERSRPATFAISLGIGFGGGPDDDD